MQRNISSSMIKLIVVAFIAITSLSAVSVFAQNYTFSLQPRRAYDKIYVEIWAKADSTNSPKLGFASLVLQYNTNFLVPSATQVLAFTDSIKTIVPSLTQAVETISSPFNAQSGYQALASQSYTSGFYSLELTLDKLGAGGIVPSSTGRGTFIGKLSFDIIGSPISTDLAHIMWSKSILPGDLRLFDADGNDIENTASWIDVPVTYTVVGLSLLSPNGAGIVIDRDDSYTILSGDYADGGYPLYFERSVNPALYSVPSGPAPALDEDLAYLFEYSLDNGKIWKEIGRVTESDRSASLVANNPQYKSGELFEPKVGTSYLITTHNGSQITQNNFRQPLRIIWKKNQYYSERSEQARLRISKIAGNFGASLGTRQIENIVDTNDVAFILGRLFFLQLNGSDEYLRTSANFSNSTQVTVEAWVNLNTIHATDAEPAIVALSGGPNASPLLGSSEGAWMLFLKDGNRPAFRVREILARGTAPNNIYLGELVAPPIKVVSAAAPLTIAHSKNWVHIAATVKDNVMSLYVDGELEERLVNNNATDIRMMTSSQQIWIGVNPNLTMTPESYLNAGVKSVRVWRNALQQDEIRKLASGIVSPGTIGDFDDIRKGLEIYYSFEGNINDLAGDTYYQNSKNSIDYLKAGNISNNFVLYRPDRPHLKITAPKINSGVLNKIADTTQIRWIGYGLGDNAITNSNDVEIEYSIDGGGTWYYAKDPAGATISGVNAPDIGATKANWVPYKNNDVTANLRTINPYSRDTWLRARGTAVNTQEDLIDISGPFIVAPYCAIRTLEGSQMYINGDEAMNITGNSAFFEAWIRPYRFPSLTEEYFPILEKTDSVTNANHYSFRLLPTGQLQFIVTDIAGVARIATSSLNNTVARPNSIDTDSDWTHVAALFVRNGNTGPAEVRFYIDGVPQSGDELAQKIGDAIDLNSSNPFPLYIGSTPMRRLSFVGEMKEVKLWRAIPNNYSISGGEPTQLTTFVQASQSVLTSLLPISLKTNLSAAYSFNGGTFVIDRKVDKSLDAPSYVLRSGTNVKYVAAKPFIKLVEPAFRQSVDNSNKNVRVRWVGNYYDGLSFNSGAPAIPPSLEFSLRGGGGSMMQPYQYVGSDYWQGNTVDAASLPNDDLFRFNGTGTNVFYAMNLNASVADPDENNDGNYNDQGALSASLTNARLRLSGKYQINGEMGNLVSEGQLFTITPSSNFTVRVLLEGYHRGGLAGSMITNLASSFDRGGLRIQLYSDNANQIGAKVGKAVESIQSYADRDPFNKNAGNNKFANVNFIYTDLINGNYWVLVEHLNHLPIMSRFAAPFQFSGDVQSTWAIESGWDFLSWNGTDNNVLTNPTANPWLGGLYTARGYSLSTKSNSGYSTTGLIFNGGVLGNVSPLAAMVGGDTQRDGQINAADRVLVRQDDGTTNPRSDVTGDNFVNGLDRTITDRNFGKVSSLYNESLGLQKVNPNASNQAIRLLDPFNASSAIDPAMAEFFNENAKKAKKPIENKNQETTLAGMNYKVTAETSQSNDFVDVAVYIQNIGTDFALANCTFALSYNTSSLNFNSLLGQDSVIFSNKAPIGYASLRTAPNASSSNPLTDVRTIEVDYDAYANLGGINVPHSKTYLGTLRFAIKDKRGSISFKWHDSKVVITTLAYDATKYGQFEAIPSFLLYSAEMISPNGGEKYAQKKAQKVEWTSNGTAPIYVEFSSNAGTQWTRLNAEDIAANTKSLNWITPDISSSFCLIRIVDAATGTELDRSNSNFSIVPNFAQIVRPATYDAVYQGGSNDKIRWIAQGPDCVKFEFSSDGGSTWKPAIGNTDASKGEISWKVPSVSTKTGVVRMLDCENDVELARSGFFKILFGNLVFSTPRTGETLISTRYYRIAWTYSNLTEYDMQFSTDGGSSWELIEKNVVAKNRSMNWLVADRPSDNAIIRGIWNGDGDMEYGRTGTFKIITFTSVDNNQAPEILHVYPNPADKLVFMNINTGKNEMVSLSLVDLLGNQVFSKSIQLEANTNALQFDISNVPSGNYYIIINSNTFKAVKELRVIR